MIQVGFLLLLCTAAVPAYRHCVDTFEAATNFNATKFAGLWHEVRQIFATPGREGTCGAAQYTENEDGSLQVELSWVDTENENQKLRGTITNDGDPTDAQLTFTFGEESADYTIFHLAYGSIFGVYSCVDNKADVFVFAKTKEVDDEALKPINKAMTKNGLDPNSLSVTDQENCPSVAYSYKRK